LRRKRRGGKLLESVSFFLQMLRRLDPFFFNNTSPSLSLSLSLHSSNHPQIKIETGEIARQANGAVTLTDGETILLATACAEAPPSGSSSNSSQQHGDGSFVPLQVNYSERFSAAGRTTGSFFKRDGRPKDSETLVSRLVDRPLRPNFAKGWSSETQVLVWVVSYDGAHSPEPLAITAAGAALAVSDIPLAKAVVGARVALLPVSEK
jgi:polyribonucleotide nucleotidyltransferase